MDERKMKELDRIRNDLIQKADKQFDRTLVSVSDGYNATKEKANLQEGETWTDHDGKTWTRKNGVVQSVSKNVSARMPWWCPKCTKSMSHRLDRKFWNIHNMCMNCVIEWHTKMKLDGTFEEYERKAVRENEKSFLKEKIQESEDFIRTFRTPQAHFSDGRWEELANKSLFNKTFDEVKQDIEFCKSRLQQILNEEENEKQNS